MKLQIISRAICLLLIAIPFGLYGYHIDVGDMALIQDMSRNELLAYIEEDLVASQLEAIFIVFMVGILVYIPVELTSYCARYIIKRKYMANK